MPFNAAMFEGMLACTDADKLRSAVISGIGRGKAFGMGLLSLAVPK
jgi:CRISPR system Cascade subunit CasE